MKKYSGPFLFMSLAAASLVLADSTPCVITSSSATISDFDMSPFVSNNSSSGAIPTTFLVTGGSSLPVGSGAIGFLNQYITSLTSAAVPIGAPQIPTGVVLPETTWFITASAVSTNPQSAYNGTTSYLRVPAVPAWSVANEAQNQLTTLIPECDWVRYRWDYGSIRPFVLTQASAASSTMVLKEISTKGLTQTQLQNFLNDIESIVGAYGAKAIQGASVYNIGTYGKLFRTNILDLVTTNGTTSGLVPKYMLTMWGTAQR